MFSGRGLSLGAEVCPLLLIELLASWVMLSGVGSPLALSGPQWDLPVSLGPLAGIWGPIRVSPLVYTPAFGQVVVLG